ncbi:MAG TPA: hypothetical protein VK542_03510, partial [Gemmatimonadaceae bacterium]|nr:hypothetical protein [Gemmatimonadaceae bacterium]
MKEIISNRISRSAFPAILVAVVLIGACSPIRRITGRAPSSAALGDNPFGVESNLPFHAPRFDLIRNEHYQPALDEGMRQQLAEIDAIAKQTEA